MRILVADDEEGVALSTTLILELEGHHTTIVSDGVQALDALNRGEAFDLLITDNSMPEMSGLELVRTLQANDNDIPIILLSAFLSQAQQIELRHRCVHSVLEKPFDVSALLDAVRACKPR